MRKVTKKNDPFQSLIFEPVPIGFKKNVAYLIGDSMTNEFVAVDVGFRHERFLERIQAHAGNLNFVIATHGHQDHIGEAHILAEATGAKVAAFETLPNVDHPLRDGDLLSVGSFDLEVLHTPGHTPECICLLVTKRKLLTGDTMYVGKVPGAGHCNKKQAQDFYDSVHRLMQLDDDIEIWPGHDVGKTSFSTIGRERQENSCVSMDFRGFWKGRRYDPTLARWFLKRDARESLIDDVGNV